MDFMILRGALWVSSLCISASNEEWSGLGMGWVGRKNIVFKFQSNNHFIRKGMSFFLICSFEIIIIANYFCPSMTIIA